MWAKPKLENGDIQSILDSNIDSVANESQMERTMTLTTARCLSQVAQLRPTMNKILKSGMESKMRMKRCFHARIYDELDVGVYPDSSA